MNGFSPALELDALLERLKADVDGDAVMITARTPTPVAFRVEALPLIEPMFHDRRAPEWKADARSYTPGTAQRKRRQQQRRGGAR